MIEVVGGAGGENLPDKRQNKNKRGPASEPARPNNQHAGVSKPQLACRSNLGEQHLPVIPLLLVVSELFRLGWKLCLELRNSGSQPCQLLSVALRFVHTPEIQVMKVD